VFWFRSFWQKVKKPLKIASIILACLLGVGFIVSFIGGYYHDWTWTGFGPYTPPTKDSGFQRGKTLYDWLQLFFIPAAIAFGVWWLSRLQQQRDQRLAEGNQREAALKEYYNIMSELLLHENLRKSDPDAEVRNLARVWTLTVLPRLDSYRKRSVLQFVYDSGLITKGRVIVDLDGAILAGAFLYGAHLSDANLSGASLGGADLNSAELSDADLIQTDLSFAELRRANLGDANLKQAFMVKADLKLADLRGANLQGTTLTNADLFGARLQRANLTLASLNQANLSGANLSEANLTDAFLNGADLQGATLEKANLTGADVTTEQLNKAKSLKGAIMHDGSVHP
jgi:uncharacterized protein YjbI with pentapeptide repeats